MGESVASKLEMVFLIDDGIHVGMIPKQNMAFLNEVYGSAFMLKKLASSV